MSMSINLIDVNGRSLYIVGGNRWPADGGGGKRNVLHHMKKEGNSSK